MIDQRHSRSLEFFKQINQKMNWIDQRITILTQRTLIKLPKNLIPWKKLNQNNNYFNRIKLLQPTVFSIKLGEVCRLSLRKCLIGLLEVAFLNNFKEKLW